jgi:hypothetical protein
MLAKLCKGIVSSVSFALSRHHWLCRTSDLHICDWLEFLDNVHKNKYRWVSWIKLCIEMRMKWLVWLLSSDYQFSVLLSLLSWLWSIVTGMIVVIWLSVFRSPFIVVVVVIHSDWYDCCHLTQFSVLLSLLWLWSIVTGMIVVIWLSVFSSPFIVVVVIYSDCRGRRNRWPVASIFMVGPVKLNKDWATWASNFRFFRVIQYRLIGLVLYCYLNMPTINKTYLILTD